MDIQKEREAFEEKFPIPAHWIEFDKKRNKYFCPYCADAAASAYQSQWETWQAVKAQEEPEGFVLVNKKDLVKVLNCVTDDWLVDTDSFEEFKKIESLVQDEVNAMIEAQEPAND